MSYPPPGSGQYPHYIPPPQYQHGQIPPQVLYNNAGPPPSPYEGYGKPNMYPPAMMSYPQYPSTYTQQPQPQPQQSRLPPQTPPQQRPQLQPQAIQPRPQPGPQLLLQIQSPPPRQPPPPPPAAPPQIQQEELHHQFVNPSQLFVQQPLPTAPRSRYTQIAPQYGDPQMLPPPSSSQVQPAPLIAPQPPTPAQIVLPPISPKPNTQPKQGQANMQKPQPKPQPKSKPKPAVKAEPKPPRISPKIPPQQIQKTPVATPTVTPIATPIPTSKRPQPTPSPVNLANPQVKIPASSPDVQAKMQAQALNKQPPANHVEKKRPSQQFAEKHGKHMASKSTKPPVDYQVLLLSLADEYLNAAHARGTITSMATRQTDVEDYYKLVATGLGCLEAVLKVAHPSRILSIFTNFDTTELAIAAP
jgi:hypothetical protein